MTTQHQEQKYVSYGDKLITHLQESKQETFSIEDLSEHIADFQEIQRKKKLQKTSELPVGKYKYKKVSEVFKFDAPYLRWLAKQEWLEKYPDLMIEIKKYV
jgi:hypothetical protein